MGTTWRANQEIIKALYQGTVRPYLDYGSIIWMSTTSTNQSVIDKVRNQVLHVIAKATKFTPIKAIEELTAISPLSLRRDAKELTLTNKYEFLPDHDMKQKSERLTKSSVQNKLYP